MPNLKDLKRRKDNLADIYWWMKGYIQANGEWFSYDPHVVALRDTIQDINEQIEKLEKIEKGA